MKVGLFHEGLPLVQRDRNAAWFAEPDGAQLLICSEIGSEGRNFQFAHHLVLFDLPLNPGLLEQRIGRLDRIGQTQTIRIHVPYVESSSEECVLDWYHRGLDAIRNLAARRQRLSGQVQSAPARPGVGQRGRSRSVGANRAGSTSSTKRCGFARSSR